MSDRCGCQYYLAAIVVVVILIIGAVYALGYETGLHQRLREHPGYVAPRLQNPLRLTKNESVMDRQ